MSFHNSLYLNRGLKVSIPSPTKTTCTLFFILIQLTRTKMVVQITNSVLKCCLSGILQNKAGWRLNNYYIFIGKPNSVIHLLLNSFVIVRRYSFSLKWRLYLWKWNPIFSNSLIEGVLVFVIFTKYSFNLR